MGLYRFQPLANIRAGAGLDKGDGPVVNVAIQIVDLLSTLRPDKIVRNRLVIVKKIVFDAIALVSQSENEFFMPEVGVILH